MTNPDDAQWRRPAHPVEPTPDERLRHSAPGAGGPNAGAPGAGAPSATGPHSGAPGTGGPYAGAPGAGGPDVPWRPGYAGPPSSAPPPRDWQPEVVVQPAPPRALPAQHHADIDARESSARTITYGIGLVAAAVLLVVMCALCGRAVL